MPFKGVKIKELFEMIYWRLIKLTNKSITNYHFEEFYTKQFNLTKDYFDQKIILDLGCGPRGSLDWATNAKLKIGLDPLAYKFNKHIRQNVEMDLICSYGENIAVKDNVVNVVTSFNSLDHVDNLIKVIHEIERVLKKDGVFLLITDVGHKKTPTEPQEFSWDLIELFRSRFHVVSERHLEKVKLNAIYESIRRNVPYNHSNKDKRYGILIVQLEKK